MALAMDNIVGPRGDNLSQAVPMVIPVIQGYVMYSVRGYEVRTYVYVRVVLRTWTLKLASW